MKKSFIKISWPNNIETYASEGDDWFSTAEKAGLEIPTGCLTAVSYTHLTLPTIVDV